VPKLERQLKQEASPPPPPLVTKMKKAKIDFVRRYVKGAMTDDGFIEQIVEDLSETAGMSGHIEAKSTKVVADFRVGADAAASIVIARYGRSGKTILELVQEPDSCQYYTSHEQF
jgi:hypothetical protein